MKCLHLSWGTYLACFSLDLTVGVSINLGKFLVCVVSNTISVPFIFFFTFWNSYYRDSHLPHFLVLFLKSIKLFVCQKGMASSGHHARLKMEGYYFHNTLLKSFFTFFICTFHHSQQPSGLISSSIEPIIHSKRNCSALGKK